VLPIPYARTRSLAVPPLGLIHHARRDVLLLEPEFPDHPATLQGYDLRPVEDWARLMERVRWAAPSSVALVRAGGAGEDAARLRELIAATPSVPVVAAMALGEVDAGRVREVVAAGVAEVANLSGTSGLEAIVPTLRRAHSQPLERRMEARLPVWVPEEARTLLRAAAQTVVDRGGRDVFAGIFGVYFRTVSAWCAELRLPPPRRLLGWMRVLLALQLLEEGGRTVMNAALCSGYNDNSSLKRAVQNFAGAHAAASVRGQRFDDAFDGFVAELRALRHAGRRARPPARA
jgi:AraC-like DNA-binding protein